MGVRMGGREPTFEVVVQPLFQMHGRYGVILQVLSRLADLAGRGGIERDEAPWCHFKFGFAS